jgi:hypothetical protein
MFEEASLFQNDTIALPFAAVILLDLTSAGFSFSLNAVVFGAALMVSYDG